MRSVVKRLAVSEGRKELISEGSNLLLNSERGAGGVVVSKEEVAVGRKGSGGAWGSTSRNAGLAPKWSNTNTGEKSSEAVGRRAVGCKLVVLKMACSQSGCKILRHFSVPPVRAL
jgi:hypothetical protein